MPEKIPTIQKPPSKTTLDIQVGKIKAKEEAEERIREKALKEAIKKGCLIHKGQELEALRMPHGKAFLSCPICRKERQEAFDKAAVEEARIRAEARKRQAEVRLAKNIEAAEIPPTFKDCSLDNYKVENDGQAAALKKIRVFLEGSLKGPGLLLRGNNGNGKTHLMTATMNEVLKNGHTALYIKSLHIFWAIRDADKILPIIKRFTDPDLLVIDEFGKGVQHGTDFERIVLNDIFDCRYAAGKPTFIAGNATVEAVEKYLGPRILDRYAQGGTDIVFTWDSYRRKEGKNGE